MKKILYFLSFFIALTFQSKSQSINSLPFVIDGLAESSWDFYTGDTIGHILENTGYTGSNDISGYFQMAWDDSAFYLLLKVNDDMLFNSNPTSWQNDNVELYFDRENFKPQSFDGNNFQLSLVRNETASLGTYSGNVPVVGLKTHDIVYSLVNHDSGYTAEFKFAWTSLGYTAENIPTEGSLIGFDVVISDNDNGARDAILAWNTSGIYNTYETPSVWGSIELYPEHKAGRAVHLDEISPSTPGLLSYTLVENNIVLHWNRSSDNISVQKYNVYDEYLNLVSVVTDTFCIIPYDQNKEYNFVVSALDGSGNESDISNSVTVTPTSNEYVTDTGNPCPYVAGRLLILPVDYESIFIYTIMGEEAAIFNFPGQHVDIGNLKQGLYIIKAKTVSGKSFATKIIF